MRIARALPFAAAALVFVAGAERVIRGGGQRSAGFASGSVFAEAPDGASLAFRYLKQRADAGRGKAPLVLAHRLAPGRLPADAVLIRLEPRRTQLTPLATEPPDRGPKQPRPARPLLAPAEQAWLREGGRLVLAVAASYGPLTLKQVPAATVRKTFPIWPGVLSLAPPEPLGALSGDVADAADTLFAAGATRVLARQSVGRGELLLLSAPGVIENARLAQADHLRLLEALAPPERVPAFDEWVHGLEQEESLPRLLFAWGFGPALATGALGFGLALWRSRARLGPPEHDALEARSEAVDLVESLSQLYDRALSRREAAALDLEGFRRAVAVRTGLAGAALEARTRSLTGTLPPLPRDGEISAAELGRRLRTLNDAYRRLNEHAHTRRRP